MVKARVMTCSGAVGMFSVLSAVSHIFTWKRACWAVVFSNLTSFSERSYSYLSLLWDKHHEQGANVHPQRKTSHLQPRALSPFSSKLKGRCKYKRARHLSWDLMRFSSSRKSYMLNELKILHKHPNRMGWNAANLRVGVSNHTLAWGSLEVGSCIGGI